MLRHCNNQEKELFLAVLLSVQAQGVLGNLSGEALNDIDELARALIESFLRICRLSSMEYNYLSVERRQHNHF